VRSIGIKIDPWPEPARICSDPKAVFLNTPIAGYFGSLGEYTQTESPVAIDA
jgi:hypothetical protein